MLRRASDTERLASASRLEHAFDLIAADDEIGRSVNPVLDDRLDSYEVEVAGQELAAGGIGASVQRLGRADIEPPDEVGSHAIEPVDPQREAPVGARSPGGPHQAAEPSHDDLLTGPDDVPAGKCHGRDRGNHDEGEPGRTPHGCCPPIRDETAADGSGVLLAGSATGSAAGPWLSSLSKRTRRRQHDRRLGVEYRAERIQRAKQFVELGIAGVGLVEDPRRLGLGLAADPLGLGLRLGKSRVAQSGRPGW